MTAFLACIVVWTTSLALLVFTTRYYERQNGALQRRIAVLEDERHQIGGLIKQIIDRIGVARSLSHETQVAYALAEEMLRRYYPGRFETISWQERRIVIQDLRRHASKLVEDAKDENKETAIAEARAVNEAANRIERDVRGWSCR